MRKTSVLATIVATVLLTTTAAATLAKSEPEPAELTGIDWALTSITADGTMMEVPAGVPATLRLEAGEANGSGGCNQFFGDYHVDGPILSLGPLGVTKRLCDDPAQVVEDAYLPALATVAYWEVADDGTLRLLDEEMQEVLAFIQASGGIEDTTWLLRQQAVDGALAAIPDGVLASLRMEDGDAGGSGGCNRYSTSYLIDGENITFGPVASTKMFCEGPGGDVEAAYLANLAAVATWASDGSRLTFADSAGSSILEYEAAAEASVVGSWLALSINNGTGGAVNSAMTPLVTAEFSAESELTGTDGCNQYFTSYEVDGDAIAIGPIGSTMMACADEELAEQSQWYFAALEAATTWSVTDTGNLELRDDSGALQVSYSPAAG